MDTAGSPRLLASSASLSVLCSVVEVHADQTKLSPTQKSHIIRRVEYTPSRIRQSSIMVYLSPKKQEPLGDLRRNHEGRLTHKSIGETSHQQRTSTQNMCDHVYTIVIDPLLCVMRMITTMSDLNIFTRYWTPRTSQSPIVQGRVLELNELATNSYQKYSGELGGLKAHNTTKSIISVAWGFRFKSITKMMIGKRKKNKNKVVEKTILLL